MAGYLLVGGVLAAWIATVVFMRRRGARAVLRHLSGGLMAFVALAVIGIFMSALGMLKPVAAPVAQAPVPVAPVTAAVVPAPAPAASAADGEPDKWDKLGIVPIDTKEPETPKTPVDPKQALRDENDARAISLATISKENMDDPRSFELVKVLVAEKGGICMRFRFKNRFNATVTEEVAVTAANKPTTSARACPPGQNPREVTTLVKYFM